MIIKSLSGKTIYSSMQRTVRAALEEGVAKGVDFSFADLRKAKLSDASLDGMVAVGAVFWGADLDGADLGIADLRKADMRCANFKDCCLAESDLSGADMRGAYFSRTIIEEAVLDGCRASCPSFWDMNLASARSLKGAVFSHRGEEDILVDPKYWVLQGCGPRIVLNGDRCLWRGRLYQDKLPTQLQRNLLSANAKIQSLLGQADYHIANTPMPKSAKAGRTI